MNPENIRNIIALAVLILMSGYFSATETAFLSCNKTRLRTMAEKGNKRAALVNRLNENYDRLLSTILIGNNIVNLTAASIGTVLFVRLYGDIGATVSTAVITVLVLIFGEITPKNVAKDCPEKLAMFSAPIIRVLIWIFTPLNFLFGLWKKLISKVLHLESDSKMSQEELLMLVEEVREGGTIDSEEGDLLKNAIEFNDMRAEDILTHRVDLEAVNIESTKEEIAEVFTQSKFARLPVYEDSIDNIIGILNMKDFYDGTGITAKSIRDIMTKPLFVLKSEKIDELLKLLQETKSQMAVILDEYGGTLGIVTLEDILEELVGEIWDEHDEVTEEYIPIGENRWRVDCSVNLDDFCDFFGIETDSTTISLGGWVMEQLGKVPEAGDSFEFECLSVSVVETDGQRVTFIDVEKKLEEAEEE
ncbi:hemolysins and related proteins containing CBS domains [Candidatus Colimorpha enterica]|uniref:Hemolysins and related proteins containing CBS domains n=1 Tax=Candidatus Colimorpha enterica TaxID=3083063 RepID=R6U112_9BACT|nr:hemolysins and related proteins containing CBS domains [Candidatus Colimorpha enterica]